MSTTSIRIGRSTRDRLKSIAERENASLGQVVDELLDHYEEQQFRRRVYESFRGLREDDAEWDAYKEMVRPWDATLLDGLEDESPVGNDSEE